MFCGKCGSNIPKNSVYCPICGKEAVGGKAVGSTYGATVKPKKPKKKLIIGIVIAVVLIAALVLALLLIPRGPEKMLVEFGVALYEGDFEKAWDAANFDKLYEILDEAGYLNEDYYIGYRLERFCGTSNYDLDDVYEAFYDYYDDDYDRDYERAQDRAEDYFGDDWDYDYEISSTEEMSGRELR